MITKDDIALELDNERESRELWMDFITLSQQIDVNRNDLNRMLDAGPCDDDPYGDEWDSQCSRLILEIEDGEKELDDLMRRLSILG